MFVNRDGIPTLITKTDKIVLISALDDDLEKWSAPVPVEPKILPDQDGSKISSWDPDIWSEGNTTYALHVILRIKPLRELEQLRHSPICEKDIVVENGATNTWEILLRFIVIWINGMAKVMPKYGLTTINFLLNLVQDSRINTILHGHRSSPIKLLLPTPREQIMKIHRALIHLPGPETLMVSLFKNLSDTTWRC